MAFMAENPPEVGELFFGRSGGDEPVVNYVARLDGVSQYWQLSGGGIPLSNGDSFTFDAVVESTGLYSYVFDDDGGSFSRLFLIVNPDSTVTFRDYNMNLKVDGVSYVNGDTITFNDGSFHKFEVESLASVTLSKLGSRFNEVELMSGVFKNLTVSKNGNTTNEIPLTNKAQGATQLATVGGVNATMANYTPDVWEALPEPETINYVAKLDGATQYWQLSEDITIPIGGTAEFEIAYEANGNSYMLANSDKLETALYLEDAEVLDVYNTNYLDNIFVDGVSTGSLPYGETFHKVSVESTSNDTRVGLIGSRFTIERFIRGAVKRFIVKDAVGTVLNEIPLTNKEQGATQLPTIGSVSAFMPNYTEDVWEVDNASQ